MHGEFEGQWLHCFVHPHTHCVVSMPPPVVGTNLRYTYYNNVNLNCHLNITSNLLPGKYLLTYSCIYTAKTIKVHIRRKADNDYNLLYSLSLSRPTAQASYSFLNKHGS